MRKITIHLILGVIVVFNISGKLFAQEKLAQTGMQFLSVISDARAAALAGAVTSLETNSSALFFNPATMGFNTNLFDASFSMNKWIADINHQNISLSVSPAEGEYGVFALSLQLVDYGEILGTVVANTDLGYTDIGKLSASSYAAGFGYSKRLSDKFSVGGQVKYVSQDLADATIPATDSTTKSVENKASGLAFDFGTLFKTGYKSLQFGMSVRNFSQEFKYAQEGFELPLTFSLGISMNVFDFTSLKKEEHSLLVSINALDARSHSAQIAVGGEYTFLNKFMLRAGYLTNSDENDVSFGVGASIFGFVFDYSYTPYGVFGNIQRLSARFSY
ncbi:MAG: PorV/PorQ family protein [Ignavibacteriae bacterium]|nr:PorV/PorQ family protein [Ignavibacteriota bacterium]MCB9209057.1 PorV/PorQ family protein [Ignavibacteriales bacterium]MCB9218022.1 PorV/PorQ family protein [Ignavibacteriales bacterium]MCB9260411.1 PorV/PorQ family protein [Ignavibacteriales bacterium]